MKSLVAPMAMAIQRSRATVALGCSIFALAACSASGPATICEASANPQRYVGKRIAGKVALISASPHGMFLDTKCDANGYGFIVTTITDVEADGKLGTLLARLPPQELVEGVVTGTVHRLSKGGWGIKISKIEGMATTPILGSGYKTSEAIERSLE